MIKAVFLDFYGTVVHEDGEIIKIITKYIFDSGSAEKQSDIGAFWWTDFQNLFLHSYGETFKTQRELETQSLKNTLLRFQSTENAEKLSELMFDYWINPIIFDESKSFFETCSVPVYIVSNIDNYDINKALAYHNLHPADVITSENARSYKPRKEIFEYALRKARLSPDEVVHVGDSITTDVKGAAAIGINTVWLNRYNKNVSENVGVTVSNLMDIFYTKYFLE